MKTPSKLILLAAMLGLSACAEVVKKNYSPSRSGVVRYSTGWFLADKNREKALEEIKGFCGSSRYLLKSEENRKEFTGQSYTNSETNGNHSSGTTTQGSEGFVYLRFQCRKS
jgi:hypothetical protein